MPSDRQPTPSSGGAACALLGSERATEDVDFVVPAGSTKAARSILKEQPERFDVDRRTQHTFYKSTPAVEVEILAPPALFQQNFDASTPTMSIGGAKVLKPMLILNAKCRSILGRAKQEKKDSDASDIQFLLQWCTTNQGFPTAEEVPNATKDFVSWFVGAYGDQDLWTNAKYDMEKGTF